LIVDDYGHWMGSRKATDEYFAAPGLPPILLNRIDYTGRIGVKS
jgi:O-methyltransferase